MNARALLLAVTGALLLSAETGAALDLNGNLGAGYSRNDFSQPGGSGSGQTWDWSGDLSLSGLPLPPELFDLSGGARYLGQSTSAPGAGSRSSAWGYRLNLGLLNGSEYPVNLSMQRNRVEFTDLAADRTGTTINTDYAGMVQYAGGDLPSLSAMVRRSQFENHAYGAPDASGQSDSLQVIAFQDVQGLAYRLQYDTAWNSGSYAESNYQAHGLVLNSQAFLGREVRAFVDGNYFLRLPTGDTALNPRTDSEGLGVRLLWDPDATLSAQLGYSYAQNLSAIPGSPLLRQASHGVTASVSARPSKDWTYGVNAGASFADLQGADGRRQTSGEQLGGSATWQRDYAAWQLRLGGGASIGLLQSAAADQLGYGASFTVGASTRFGAWNAGASYGLGYNQNTGGVEARTLSQSLNFSAAGPSVARGRLSATLALTAARNDVEVLGTSGSRNVRLDVLSTWGPHQLRLEAGLLDGLSDALKGGTSGDGLFLPLSYNTKTRYLTLTGTWSFRDDLSLIGLLRYLYLEAPGRPASSEDGLALVARYTLASWTLSFEDRLTSTSAAGGSLTVNLLMARITRFFGTSW